MYKESQESRAFYRSVERSGEVLFPHTSNLSFFSQGALVSLSKNSTENQVWAVGVFMPTAVSAFLPF